MADDAEPPPLVPSPSERLIVKSRCSPWEAPRLLSAGTCFGPSKRSLSRPVPLPSPRVRDFSPPPPTEYSACPEDGDTGFEDEVEALGEAHALHKAVWLADLPRVRALLEAGANINQTDAHSATPLMLAVELRPRASEYDTVIRHLLEADADPRLRSAQGWSPLDEAVSRGDEQLVRLLFDSMQGRLRERWDKRLSLISTSLALLPDFECRIKWEFESPVLPLVNRLAPSDVVHLRKRGTSLRVDSTLASWKRFRLSKRRELTTLFQGAGSGGGGGATASSSGAGSLLMLNHSKRTVVDVTEGLHKEEAGAVLGDLVSADVMQWDMKLDNLAVAEATTWLGGIAPPCEINGWRTLRFDVCGTFGVSVRKKGRRRNDMTFQEYFGCSLPPDACLPELREEFKEGFTSAVLSREASRTTELSGETLEYEGTFDLFDRQPPPGISRDVDTASNASEVLAQWPGAATPRSSSSTGAPGGGAGASGAGASGAGDSGPRPSTGSWGSQASGRFADLGRGGSSRGRRGSSLPGISDKAGKTTHRVNASVWLATDFAISLQQFLPILDALAVEHEAMRRLKELLSSESLKSAVDRTQRAIEVAETGPQGADTACKGHVFPVRASIPVNIAVRALVHFEAFKLQPAGSLPAELFAIPADYSRVSRAEAQKTPKRAKKRMLLANLAL